MDSAPPTLPIVTSIFVLVAGYETWKWLNSERKTYAPGPRPKPIVGNMFDIPASGHAEEYIRWGEKYKSEILFTSSLGSHTLVLNKQEDAEELLDRRSRIYSDRDQVPMVPFIGFDSNSAFLPYGDVWRSHKRIYQQHLRPAALQGHHPLQHRVVGDLLRNIVELPDKAVEQMRLLSVALPLNLMYGYTPPSFTDPAVYAAEQSLHLGATLYLPGTTLANVFPILTHIPSWFPGAGFKRKAERAKFLSEESKRIPWEFTQKEFENGTHHPSLLSNYLERAQNGNVSPDELKVNLDIGYTAFVGASDTTSNLLANFVYAMAAHPHIQEKARKVLDSVIGTDRLPNFDDRLDMPYIEAVVYELLRWRPPVPLSVPHVSTEDDYYKGYFIPKGTVVMSNVIAMSQDKEKYNDPEVFNPDRFLNPDGTLRTNEYPDYVFGFGRRGCPGKHFAKDTLWLTIASVLAVFKFGPQLDESGNEMYMDPSLVDNGLLYSKAPFPCQVVLRSENARCLVENTKHSAYTEH